MAEQLRKIQHDAYYNVVKAASIADFQLSFMEREKFFTTLRDGLHISPEQHHAIMSKLEQDDSVNRIRDALGKSGGVKRPRPADVLVSKAPAAPAPKRAMAPKAAPAKPAKAVPQHAGPVVINEHVGERLKMYWPEEGGWFDAIISDYNPNTDEHCLTYHINSPEETFEWVHLKDLKEGEYRRLGRDTNLAALLSQQAGAGRSTVPARGGRGPSGKAGGAAPAAAVPVRTGLAEIESQINRARDPKKLEEVQQQLAAQAEAMRAKLQQLQSDSDDDDAGGMTESESE